MKLHRANRRLIRPRARDIGEVMAWLRERGGFAGTPPAALRECAERLMRLRILVDSKLVLP